MNGYPYPYHMICEVGSNRDRHDIFHSCFNHVLLHGTSEKDVDVSELQFKAAALTSIVLNNRFEHKAKDQSLWYVDQDYEGWSMHKYITTDPKLMKEQFRRIIHVNDSICENDRDDQTIMWYV